MRVPYRDIPGFHAPTVLGHKGELVAAGALETLRSQVVPGGTLEEVFLHIARTRDIDGFEEAAQ